LDSKALIKFYSKDSDNSDANLMEIDFSGLWDADSLKIGINTDIVVAKVGRREKISTNGRSAIFYNSFVRRNSSGTLNGFFSEETLKFNETTISDDIFMIGYPKSLGLQQNIQYDFDRPLIRKGILSGRYQKNKTLIIDCPSFFGNSGGPIVEIHEERTFLIGIVTQLIPFTDSGKTFLITQNSGFSIVEPIDKVLEVIKQFKK
jgi:hypothetical protein